jgi:hypothetical protein
MTADEQIERLDDRVTRLEDRTNQEIVAIHTKLDALLTLNTNAQVEVAKKPDCPSPGACIVLGESLKATIAAHNATMLRVERLELRMLEIEKWQGRMFGGVAVLMTLLTLFAPMIRQLFNLE